MFKRSMFMTAILATIGCAPETVSAPRQGPDLKHAVSAAREDETIERLGRSFALALQDTSLRMQLLQDLRDSPFPQHSIHLQSYLAGKRGFSISEATARVSRLSTREFVSALARLPALEISVSSKVDRISWTGSSDIHVVATGSDLRARLTRGTLVGYNVRGGSSSVSLGKKESFPIVSILPADNFFGADAETKRACSGKKGPRDDQHA